VNIEKNVKIFNFLVPYTSVPYPEVLGFLDPDPLVSQRYGSGSGSGSFHQAKYKKPLAFYGFAASL
jgi:hypothetical protein